jgi:hypothetical protein
MLLVGPSSEEPATVARMPAFAAEQGLEERHDHARTGRHLSVRVHDEIYLPGYECTPGASWPVRCTYSTYEPG